MTIASPSGRRAPMNAWTIVATAMVLVAGHAGVALAQLDPLSYVKRLPPTVIVVVDSSFSMLTDGDGNYYDPFTYSTAADPAAAKGLGVGDATTYRRVYKNLRVAAGGASPPAPVAMPPILLGGGGFATAAVASAGVVGVAPAPRYTAGTIAAVPNTDAAYATFWHGTRLEIAKQGIAQAVAANQGATFRWGLVKLRQSTPQWRAAGACDQPVAIDNDAALTAITDASPCHVGVAGHFGVYAPAVVASNASVTTASKWNVAPAAGTARLVLDKITRTVGDGLGLIPAGMDTATAEDRPLTNALVDARAQIVAAMSRDGATNAAHRNTIVVVVTGGGEGGTAPATRLGRRTIAPQTDPVAYVTNNFLVTSGRVRRRVPVFVVGVKPSSTGQLERIAQAGGGVYLTASSAADVARAINLAVQSGFRRDADVETGSPSEFSFVSPVVGTVELSGAASAAGAPLPASAVTTGAGTAIPQRSNVMVTAGFVLGGALADPAHTPGFEGRLRAFRVYRPVADTTKPTGWRFDADGTPLWPDRDGRPSTAGIARAPAPSARNIFTFVPGRGLVAFTTNNRDALAKALGATNVDAIIDFVRAQPLGAVIGSTPAIVGPPSLEPAPDDDYGYAGVPGSFADRLRDRRPLVWFGGSDGMLHAVDARTGFEVWAFIPWNLLPKLRALVEGQPVEQFAYFVEGNPTIADVKLSGRWRTVLCIGEGLGGTFYQAFDITEAGTNGPAPDSDDHVSVLASFAAGDAVDWLWAFPRYDVFDPSTVHQLTVSDATPGGVLRLYGELTAQATPAELSVGFTWSTPVVGPLDANRTVHAALVGSGYFPPVEDLLPGRGASSPRAGRSVYLLDLATGSPLGNPSGACATTASGLGCLDLGDEPTNGRRNAAQGGLVAAADGGGVAMTSGYGGDLDGNLWRFSLSPNGTIARRALVASSRLAGGNDKPIFGTPATVGLGPSDRYVFFATGSDQLPATAAGATGRFALWGLYDNVIAGSKVKFTYSLRNVLVSGGRVDGERPAAAPMVAGDIAFFVTSTEVASQPWAAPTSRLYAFTYLGGAAYAPPGQSTVLSKSSPVAKTLAGRATAPFVVDKHAFIATTTAAGVSVDAIGDPKDYNNGLGQAGVRVISWREVR
ncbi:MAG: PilC/PilY family type IV pilus protein [Vicinamibacterales bacterium]